MTHDSTPIIATDPAAPRDELDIACIRCGYSLIGLDPRRPCPECGLLAGLSLLDGRELRHNRPRWLVGLSVGALLLALGMMTFPAIALSAEVLYYSVRRGLVPLPAGGQVVDWQYWIGGVALGLVQTAPIFVGVWLLTRPALRARLDEAARPSRIALRLLAALPLLLVAAWALAGANLLRPSLSWWVYSNTTMAALLVWGAVMAAWLFRYLKTLAVRAPAPLLAADSPLVGYTLSACLLVPLLLSAVSATGLELDLETGVGMAVMTSVVCIFAVGITAYLWCLYLLVRYAIAFGRAADQARQIMRDFDASLESAPGAYHAAP